MKLKMKQIALILAGLSTSVVSIAAPVTVAQIDAAFANATLQQAWLSGATAPTRTVYEGWVRGCDTGTNTIFSTQSGTASVPGSIGNYSSYACTRAGVVSVLYHTLDGGSLNFVTPHTIGTALARTKFVGTGNGCGATPVNYIDPTNANNNALVFKGCTQIGINVPAAGPSATSNATTRAAYLTDPNAPQWPTGGYSDVEAALSDASIGGGDVSNVGTEDDVGVSQVFTIVTSIPLYRALQVAQGITVADPDFDPVNAPNISSSQYAALASTSGEASWKTLIPNSTNTVILARRVDTSGTQSSSNAFFLRNPCVTGMGAQLAPRTRLDSVPGVIRVVEGSSTGNVKTTITQASNNTDPKETYAIGVVSAENNWRVDTPASGGYRMLKIDGVHPELGDPVDGRVTAANGDYKFVMELKEFIRADYAGQAPKTPYEARVIREITAQLKTPPAASCATFPRGLLLLPQNNSACEVGKQVSKVTNFGKNCATPTQFLN